MRFQPGAEVQALRGPFAGWSGKVVSVTGRGFVRVMQIFGGETPFEIPVDWLEAAE